MKNKEAKSIFSSLENFSSIPPPELWDAIEAQLNEPKKKKRPLIWWWVAAGLVAGLSLPTVWYVNSNDGNNSELNIENNGNGVVLQNDLKDNVKDYENVNDNHNANGNEKIIGKSSSYDKKQNNGDKSENQNINTQEASISLTNNNLVVTKKISSVSSKKKDTAGFKNSKQDWHNQLSSTGNANSQSDVIAVNKNAVVSNYNSASVISKNNSSQIRNSNEITKTIVGAEKNNISESLQNKENTKNINSQSIQENQNVDIVGLNSNTAIAENTNEKDSLRKIKQEVAQLENALAELDKDKAKKKTSSEVIDKWSLQVFAGVMGSENYNNEKALGNTVASKQSNGYGVKTNYKLNKKWAVSSGFKINELGQKIDGVAYYDRGSLSGIKSGVSAGTLLQDSPSKNNIVFVSNNENYLFASNSKGSAGYETGNVTQNLKYFEMPLEVSYTLLSKKRASINMNTGGFVGKLISNEVLLNGGSIGENKNVNEYVYGTLLSSTLQYEVLKKTKFFIEPGMNYYINPLENQSFNQFQWMFNIGLNVSF